MGDRTLDYIALYVLFFVVITIIYGIIYIHDIPYEMAKKRKHPHQDAIHTAGWVSLFLMHTIWPFLWIWATLYKPGYGWGLSNLDGNAITEVGVETQKDQNGKLLKYINELEEKRSLSEKENLQKIKDMQDRIARLESDLQNKKEL